MNKVSIIIILFIPLKVYTSSLRNAIYSFLASNDFIEQNIQKGFTPNLSGTLEHTSQMADVINKARIRQRSLVITLLELKNAFGEVHHNLIKSVLDYHHIPDQIKAAIENLYTDFHVNNHIRIQHSFHYRWSWCIARRLPQSSLVQHVF